MVKHPVHFRRNTYRGSDARKSRKAAEENRIAAELDRHVNEMLLKQTDAVRSYLWHEIASQTGHSVDLIATLGYQIDGGSNGFTAIRHDLSYEHAMELMRNGK
jgi:hypothetical protein